MSLILLFLLVAREREREREVMSSRGEWASPPVEFW